MQNLKKYIAVILMGTMFVGNCVTVFADNDGHSSVGTGENEGHVDKHVVSVTLPTVSAQSTPFNYTVDPERLVFETDGAKYSEKEFTDDAKRDGVYFLTSTEATAATYALVENVDNPDADTQYYVKDGENYTATDKPLAAFEQGTDYYTQTTPGTQAFSGYDNKSAVQTATSRSSADAELTVEVAVANDSNVSLVGTAPSTDGYTEVTVADADAFADGTFYTTDGSTYTKATTYDAQATYYKESDPELYLALMVDGAPTVLEAGKTATKTVTIAGIDNNFETTYDGDEYKYTVKNTLVSDWNTSSFYLTGVASKASAKDVTVPKLTVTWSYKDPEAEVVQPTPVATAAMYEGVAYIRLVANQAAVAEKITSVKVDGNATTNYTVSGPIAISGITGAGSHTITIVYDGTTYSGTVTIN